MVAWGANFKPWMEPAATLLRLREAATKGEWTVNEYRGSQGHECVGVEGPRLMCASVYRDLGKPDAAFIAFAANEAAEIVMANAREIERGMAAQG